MGLYLTPRRANSATYTRSIRSFTDMAGGNNVSSVPIASTFSFASSYPPRARQSNLTLPRASGRWCSCPKPTTCAVTHFACNEQIKFSHPRSHQSRAAYRSRVPWSKIQGPQRGLDHSAMQYGVEVCQEQPPLKVRGSQPSLPGYRLQST